MAWDSNTFKKYNPQKAGFGNASQWQQAFKERMACIVPCQSIPKKLAFFGDCQDVSDIEKKYKELVKRYHPDIVGNTEEACNNFILLMQEYKSRKEELEILEFLKKINEIK